MLLSFSQLCERLILERWAYSNRLLYCDTISLCLQPLAVPEWVLSTASFIFMSFFISFHPLQNENEIQHFRKQPSKVSQFSTLAWKFYTTRSRKAMDREMGNEQCSMEIRNPFSKERKKFFICYCSEKKFFCATFF